MRIDVEDEDGRSALWWAASQGHERVVKVLYQKNASADSAVALFARRGKLQALEILIASGVPLTVTNDKGQTGLHLAARYGKLDVVKMYLKRGLDIHITDDKGYTALHRASGYGHTKVARFLLEQGSNPNWKGRSNLWTPVSLAARYGHLDILKMLHQKGGDLKAVTHKGWSPLMLAERGEYPLVIQYLLENDGDKELLNSNRSIVVDI